MSVFAWLPHMRSAPRAQHTSQRGEREGYEEATDLGDVNHEVEQEVLCGG